MPRVTVELHEAPIERFLGDDQIGDPDVGAHAWFSGVTRRTTGDRITASLFYESRRPMAERELERIAQEAAERFELTAVLVVHRLGDCPVGEASIVIGCSSPHRVDALTALPWMMDRIKADVPIWKQDIAPEGDPRWVHPAP